MLRWLGLDKPPKHKVRHKVWRKQLIASTRQLRLGADRARQRTELEMLDGTEVFSVVNGAGAEPMAGGAGPESELGPAAEEEVRDDNELGDWNVGDWIAGTGVNLEEAAAGDRASQWCRVRGGACC